MNILQKSLISGLFLISYSTLIKPIDAATVFVTANGNPLDTNGVNNIALEKGEEITFTIKLDSMDTSITALGYEIIANNAELPFVNSEVSGAVLGHPFTTIEDSVLPTTPPFFGAEFSYTDPMGGVVPLNMTFDLSVATYQGGENIINDDQIDFQFELTSATILVENNPVLLDTPEELEEFFGPLQQQVSVQSSIPEPSLNLSLITFGSLGLTIMFKRYLKTVK